MLVVRVWGDQVEAIDQGEEAAKWFSTFLHKVATRIHTQMRARAVDVMRMIRGCVL